MKVIVLLVFFSLFAKGNKSPLWYFIFKHKVRQCPLKSSCSSITYQQCVKFPTNVSLRYVSNTACSVVGGSNPSDKVLTHYLDVVKN